MPKDHHYNTASPNRATWKMIWEGMRRCPVATKPHQTPEESESVRRGRELHRVIDELCKQRS